MESGCFGGQASHSAGALPAWLLKAVFLQQMGDKRGRWQWCIPTTGLSNPVFIFAKFYVFQV